MSLNQQAQVKEPQPLATTTEPHIPIISKYSNRVLLKTILTRSDNGAELKGQKVIIGGWVKSSRELKKEPVVIPTAQTQEAKDHHQQQQNKDVTCVEVLQTRLPFLRSIIKVFGGDHHMREKLDSVLPKPTQQQHSISILHVSDGSCTSSLQVILDSSLASPSHVMPTGTCIYAEGILQKPSLQGKEKVELKAEKILHIGLVDMSTYPLMKKRLPLESLRDSTHFRPRTTTVASVMRIRNALTQAINSFYQENDFMYIQVPVITSTDVKGFGQDFQVTTRLVNETLDQSRIIGTQGDHAGDVKHEDIENSIKEKTRKVEELKRNDSNKEAISAAIQDLNKTTELLSQIETKQKQMLTKSVSKGNVDYSEDYFSRKTYLTVTGRLHLESYASALGNVYTFGPRFLAHKQESRKLLAEMWLVEVEMAFSKLEESMKCAVDFLKFICKWLLENCTEDLKFVSKRIDKHVLDRLNLVATGEFEKVSYAEAVEVLRQATSKNFEPEVKWGVQLSEEQESYLADEVYKKPLIIYGHPKENVPFHVRVHDDLKRALSYDVIVPKVGTLIRGSQNEDRFNVLTSRINELGLDQEQIKWYLDLKKHGSVHCSGFSFLFDLLVLYATGLNDVRDAVPFPRSFRKADN